MTDMPQISLFYFMQFKGKLLLCYRSPNTFGFYILFGCSNHVVRNNIAVFKMEMEPRQFLCLPPPPSLSISFLGSIKHENIPINRKTLSTSALFLIRIHFYRYYLKSIRENNIVKKKSIFIETQSILHVKNKEITQNTVECGWDSGIR